MDQRILKLWNCEIFGRVADRNIEFKMLGFCGRMETLTTEHRLIRLYNFILQLVNMSFQSLIKLRTACIFDSEFLLQMIVLSHSFAQMRYLSS